jgi:MYXO-CTERM domain-containing protein
MFGVVVWVLVLAVANGAFAFSISSSQALQENTTPPPMATVLDGDGAGNDITPSGTADSFVYDWGDVNGDGNRDDAVATPGLDVGSYKVYTPYVDETTTEDADLTLNLNGGNITGQGVWNATPYHTRNNEAYWAPPRYEAITTQHSDTYVPDAHSGDINIVNVGDLSCGTISTHMIWGYGSHDGHVGAINIGEPAGTGYGPAGNIRVDNLDAQCDRDGNTAGVHVYSTGFVRIQDSDDDATATRGMVNANVIHRIAGLVEIYHEGDFRAGKVLAHTGTDTYGADDHGGTVILDGNYDNDATGTPLGTCDIELIDTSYKRNGYGNPNGTVTISGYDTVRIDKIDGSSAGPHGDAHGSDTTITAKSGIYLTDVDLGTNGGQPGVLSLTATGSEIVLGDPGDPEGHVLDLDNFDHILFDCGSGMSWIYSDIENWVEGSDKIRVANQGDIVYYSPVSNADLLLGGDNGVYELTGGGIPGTLEPIQGPVPEPAGLPLVGLALLGLKRRKRS